MAGPNGYKPHKQIPLMPTPRTVGSSVLAEYAA